MNDAGITSGGASRRTRTSTLRQHATGTLRRWNVVLLDDDEHTYDYVIEMMQSVFGRSLQDAFLIAQRVDSEKRAICCTTHREHAELKREQMLAFGRDVRIASCAGPMSVVLEPACGDDGDSPSTSGTDASGGRTS